MSPGSSRGGWSQPDGDDAPPLELLGERYELVDLLGAGGMGRVFEAFDRRLHRTVALKEVAPHLSGTPAARRLAAEALLTADLEHPGIVSVHDAGRTVDGRLYYTMRLVRGRSLAERLAEAEGLPDRLALLRHLLDACHAVGFAHSRGIAHRDLKPSNIMIGEFGETQVVDWGLARRLTDDQPIGGSAGTEGYMSPEARRGEPADPRGDVYSLGASLLEIIGADAPPDLAAIASHALCESPEARYPDAHELALDLERFLDGHPVAAYDYSPRELIARAVVAWRAPLSVAAVAALLLTATAGGAYLRTTHARDRAVAAEADTRVALSQADANLASSLEAQAAAAVRQGRLPAAQILAANSLLHAESPLARGVLLADLTGSRPVDVDVQPLPDCDGVVLGQAGLLCKTDRGLSYHPSAGAPSWGIEGAVENAAVAGGFVVVTRPGLRLELLDRQSGATLRTYEEVPGERGIAVSPDGARVAIANGHGLTVIGLISGLRWDAEPCGSEGIALASALGPDEAYVVCLDGRIAGLRSPEEQREVARFDPSKAAPQVIRWAEGSLITGTSKGVVRALDAQTGALQASVQALEGPVDRLEPVRGARLVAVSGDRGGVRLWDLLGGIEVLRLPAPTRDLQAVGPDQLLVAGNDLRLWTLPPRPRPRRFVAEVGLSSIAISPDGATLAGARGDGVVTVWATADGSVLAEDRWQDRVVKWVTFRPDGSELLATGLGDPGVRVLSTATWATATSPPGGLFRRLAALADGRVLALNYGHTLRSLRRGAWTDEGLGWSAFDVATSPGGLDAWLLGQEGQVARVRSGQTGVVSAFEHPGARSIAASRDGIALAHGDHVLIVDAAGSVLRRLETGEGGIVDVGLSHDGRWAAAGLLDGTARLWSVADERLVAVLVGHRERISSVVFSSDGRSLYTGDWHGTVLRWRLEDAERPASDLAAEAAAVWRIGLNAALAAGL